MGRIISGDFSQLRKLAANIAGMTLRHQSAVLLKGMDSATKTIADSARTKAPKDQGDLKASMTNVVRQYQGGDKTIGFVGPQKGFYVSGRGGKRRRVAKEKGESNADYRERSQGEKQPAKYAHLVEFGHMQTSGESSPAFTKGVRNKERGRTRKNGQARDKKFVPGQPFLRPAFEQGRAQLEQDLGNTTAQAMQKEFDKLSK